MFFSKAFAILMLVILSQIPVAIHANSREPIFNSHIKIKGEAARYLDEIEIRNADGSLPDSDTIVELIPPAGIRLNLGLGDSMTKIITLKPLNGEVQFRIEQRYETSLTLMNEGPHMDLLDWKHYISDWNKVEARNNLTFLVKEMSSEKFPKVTQAEIINAVKAESDKWSKRGFDEQEQWISLAKRCKGPTTYPCGVSISKIILQIKVWESNKWKSIQTMEIQIPMGC